MSKHFEYIAIMEKQIEQHKKIDDVNNKIIEANDKIIASQKKQIIILEGYIVELLEKIAVLEKGVES